MNIVNLYIQECRKIDNYSINNQFIIIIYRNDKPPYI